VDLLPKRRKKKTGDNAVTGKTVQILMELLRGQ